MKRIVVFGSINADLEISTKYFPEKGETIKGYGFNITFGGKGANQAVAASRLGAQVDFLGCVGADPFGEKCLKNLKNENINIRYVRKIEGVNTSIALIIKANKDNRIILDSTTNELLKVDDLNNYILNNIVSDSIFITQLEGDINETFKAIELAKKNKMITIFNPAPAYKIPTHLYSSIDYLIVNQTEANILSDIYPLTINDAKAIYAKLKELGLKNLIITLGALGSIVINEEILQKFDSLDVDVVDTVGAGDAYIGAFAYCLSNGKDLISACKYANIVAALSVTKSGAQGGMPTSIEVYEFLRSDYGKEKIIDY